MDMPNLKFYDVKMKTRVVGTRPVRRDGADKVTGAANFGDDFHMPNMLHAKILRSPHAHAIIKSIDVSAAEALPGVRAVISGKDMPAPNLQMTGHSEGGDVDIGAIAYNGMARDKVYYEGHALAAVAADNPHVAQEALALIKVEYEVLKPVMNVRDAMADGAPVLHENFIPGAFMFPTQKALPNAGILQLGVGDIDQGFADSDVVIEREFTTETVHQGYIEPHVATVLWDEKAGGKVTVWCSSQGAFAIRDFMSGILHVPLSKVTVVPLEIGGGFGGKDQTYMEPAAAVLSKKTGCPVKVFMSREEVLKATGPSSGTYMKIKLGAKKDGTLMAADLYLAFEAGGFPGGPIAPASMTSITRYNIPNVRLEGYDVMCNKPKIKPYRAPGSTQSHFAMEGMMNELAVELGMNSIDLRLKNAMKTGDRLIIGLPCAPIDSEGMLQAVKNHPHYNAPLGENQGRGVAYSFWFGGGLLSSADVVVNTDGTVNISEGSSDLSGTRMTLAMQGAEALGIDIEDVEASVPDTDSVGYTLQSVGSRTTFATGIAVYEACQKILADMAARAAMGWETDADDVEIGEGVFTCKSDPSKTATFKEVAAKQNHTGGPITASSSMNPMAAGFQLAANIVDVEVDKETGKVDILRFTAFQDVGKAVHPDYVEGQMQGGVVQGIGWALNEEYFYDAEGHLRNSSLLDYRMPTSLDVPMIDCVIRETPNPGHPYGVRGAGEVPIVPPPAAIADAIYDAIGVRMTHLPMSPGNVMEAIWAKEGA